MALLRRLSWTILVLGIAEASQFPCSVNLTENITNGKKTGDVIEKDNITYSPDTYFTLNGVIRGCVCNITNCVRKCCPNGFAFTNGTCVERSALPPLLLALHEGSKFVENRSASKYHVVYGHYCKKGKYRLFPDYPGDEYYFQTNGTLYVPEVVPPHIKGPDGYCVDNILKANRIEFGVYLCVTVEENQAKSTVYSIGNV